MGAAGPAPPAIILTDIQPVRRRSGRWEALGLAMVFCTQSQQAKADSTLRSSQAVPHPSTNRALRRLTSEVGRDPVYSTRYGRQRELCGPACGRQFAKQHQRRQTAPAPFRQTPAVSGHPFDGHRVCWAEARVKIARMTLTIKLDGNWNSFQLANSAPPLSVTDSAIAPSARIDDVGKQRIPHCDKDARRA
jgi:hypothetical protein